MNVLFYLYRYPGLGGIEIISTVLANYLYKRGINISFFSEKREKACISLDEGIKVFFADNDNLYQSLQNVLIKEKIDVVVLHDNYDSDANVIIRVLSSLGISLIVQEHSDPMGTIVGARDYIKSLKLNTVYNIVWRLKNFNYASRVTKRYLRRKMALVNASQKYILLSKRFEGTLKECLPDMDFSKIMAINNPLTVAVNEACLDKKEKKVVFISRFEGVKRIDYMVDIFRKSAMLNTDWSFEIYGDGSQKGMVTELAGTEANIVYKGVANHVGGVLESASILIMTSSFEGWGLVLTEAMANGCVPMAFDSYFSVRDIIDDNVNGLLVTPFDTEEYCLKLQSLIDHQEQRDVMSRKCIEKAKMFDISNGIGAQWVELLNSLKKHEDSNSKQ